MTIIIKLTYQLMDHYSLRETLDSMVKCICTVVHSARKVVPLTSIEHCTTNRMSTIPVLKDKQ